LFSSPTLFRSLLAKGKHTRQTDRQTEREREAKEKTAR